MDITRGATRANTTERSTVQYHTRGLCLFSLKQTGMLVCRKLEPVTPCSFHHRLLTLIILFQRLLVGSIVNFNV